MWDTSKDYRILVAMKSQEDFLKIIQTASFRGTWNKKATIEEAKQMQSAFQSLKYSYLEGESLTESEDVKTLEEHARRIIGFLGGDDWNHKFMEGAPKEEKVKTESNIAKVQFFLNTILGLKNRLSYGPINDPIISIDIRVGEIMSVMKHPKADNLMMCNVNLSNRAVKIVTNDNNVKENNKVGVSLLPPQSFLEEVSEGMFLGMDGNILKDVQGELGENPKGIPMESLNETRNLIDAYLDK